MGRSGRKPRKPKPSGLWRRNYKTGGLDGKDIGTEAQGRSKEGQDCAATAAGDDDDVGLDSGTFADGNENAFGPFAVLARQEMKGKLSILRTDKH